MRIHVKTRFMVINESKCVEQMMEIINWVNRQNYVVIKNLNSSFDKENNRVNKEDMRYG